MLEFRQREPLNVHTKLSIPGRRADVRWHHLPKYGARIFVATALTFAAATASVPLAHAADDREAAKKACMGDYKKYCSGVWPGGGRVKKCLTDNLDKLEPPCREIVSRNAGASKGSSTK